MKTFNMVLLIAMVCVSTGALAKPASVPVKKKVSLKVKLVSTGTPTAVVRETPAAVETVKPVAPEQTAEEKPVVKPAKSKPAKKVSLHVKPVRKPVDAAKPKVVIVAQDPASLGQFERSQINFNGLIDKSASRKHKLEKKVKAKTATREKQAPKLASYDMDDVDMKWERSPQSEPKMATPEPKSSGASNQPMNLELIPKK